MTRGFVITGRTVLIGMLAFFGIILAANGAFVYFALESWPGLSTADAYRRGVAYNDTLAGAAAQRRRGWRSAVSATPADGGGTHVEIRMTGRNGAPLTGLSATIGLRRPVGSGEQISAALSETAPGIYARAIRFPHAGQWTAEVTATGSVGAPYRMVHRITVKP